MRVLTLSSSFRALWPDAAPAAHSRGQANLGRLGQGRGGQAQVPAPAARRPQREQQGRQQADKSEQPTSLTADWLSPLTNAFLIASSRSSHRGSTCAPSSLRRTLSNSGRRHPDFHSGDCTLHPPPSHAYENQTLPPSPPSSFSCAPQFLANTLSFWTRYLRIAIVPYIPASQGSDWVPSVEKEGRWCEGRTGPTTAAQLGQGGSSKQLDLRRHERGFGASPSLNDDSSERRDPAPSHSKTSGVTPPLPRPRRPSRPGTGSSHG